MVRAPTMACPNLSRLFENAEAKLLAAFLEAKPFERLSWLSSYRFDPADPAGPKAAGGMLLREKKERLGPLEAEAARIVTIAGNRGQFALDGLARTGLDADHRRVLFGQRDELARSLWTFVNKHALFEAAENSLHLRLYRRYDKHYQTFLAEPSPEGGPSAGSDLLDSLLADLVARLDRGSGCSIDRFDIPADGEEPAAEMYLFYHPDPPTSVREIDDDGNRFRSYFRPPGEAMIVYTPSTGRVHVRAGTRRLRHKIAESFIETALDQPYSREPVDFQAYDISRFFTGFELPLPDFDDVVILDAKIIRADISMGNLANRLSLSTTIKQDIHAVIDSQPGLGLIFKRAIAIRFIEIAVRYRRPDRVAEATLDFTITDRNTSSLLSLDDPFERVLGHRLLRYWGILHEGRPPSDAESMAALPALLELWDIGAGRVSGAWLQQRHIDPSLLTEIGFLVPAGWEGDALIDDEDSVGPTDAEVIVRPEGADLEVTDGQSAPGGSPELYRVYRVRDGWVAQHLQTRLGSALDAPSVEELTPHLFFLGSLGIDGRNVPVYLARSLHQEKVRAAVDAALRARHHLGVGLVLQAGKADGQYLAANVLAPLAEQIDGAPSGLGLVADRLRAVFRLHRMLALGGQTVALSRTGDSFATLFVLGKGSIDILGRHRVLVIERLVDAHNGGPAPVATADLVKGIEGQSLSNIFGQPLWNKLKADFIRSPKKRLWEIAI